MILSRHAIKLKPGQKERLLKNLDHNFRTRQLHFPLHNEQYFAGQVHYKTSTFSIDAPFTGWYRALIPTVTGEISDSPSGASILNLNFETSLVQLIISIIGNMLTLLALIYLGYGIGLLFLSIILYLLLTWFSIKAEKKYYLKSKKRALQFIDEMLLEEPIS